jgi:hypothetical protein
MFIKIPLKDKLILITPEAIAMLSGVNNVVINNRYELTSKNFIA